MIQEILDLDTYKPCNEYSQFIKEYFSGILKHGTKRYIDNVDVQVRILEINETLIPITFGNKKDKNCYVSSMLGSIEYALYEYKKSVNIYIYYSLCIFLCPIVFLFKVFGIEDTVYVGNLLLSTNILPNLKEEELEEIHIYLTEKYPNKCVIYRSINTINSKKYIQFFHKKGYRNICFRQIFMFLKKNLSSYLRNKSIKEDRKLIEKYNFSISNPRTCSEQDIKGVKQCYDELYIFKYTGLNPQFSLDFFHSITQNSFFSIKMLSDTKKVIATYGYYTLENQSTTPVFGFILEKNKNLGLYRQISYLTLIETLSISCYLNHSSGAGFFKTHRGAEKVLEYSYFYSSHLGIRKRCIWRLLSYMSRFFIEPKLTNNLY